ncbi:hypothetical protein NVP1244A_162 [Vibrio phage 1.244.A._10N.261.54.C3]|nr:hypothetical protein NVP1244A_162 [Vibrio phage 1.244.A._10N.261.54.C3]AUR98790.1 hypothetical protein NVP1255O_162 [Vibrio phage 1.255.O._10N.286.45.F1]
MLSINVVKSIIIKVLSNVLGDALRRLGNTLDTPQSIAEASLKLQVQQVITRVKRETPEVNNRMYVKFTFPKDLSESEVMCMSEGAMDAILQSVGSTKFQFIRFGYERRGVVVKMRYKPRGCSWINEE